MAKKETGKDIAISYSKKDGKIANVKIKMKPVNSQKLLELCENLLGSIMYLELRVEELETEMADRKQKEIILRDNLSQLNGYALKHETELFGKSWIKKFLGL